MNLCSWESSLDALQWFASQTRITKATEPVPSQGPHSGESKSLHNLYFLGVCPKRGGNQKGCTTLPSRVPKAWNQNANMARAVLNNLLHMCVTILGYRKTPLYVCVTILSWSHNLGVSEESKRLHNPCHLRVPKAEMTQKGCITLHN